MNIGIYGQQGAGKTLIMSILSQYFYEQYHVPIYSNYKLLHAQPLIDVNHLSEMRDCIIVYDEVWLDMDSRTPRENVQISRIVNQLRKRNVILLATTQAMHQTDKRLKFAFHYYISCQKINSSPHAFRFYLYEPGYEFMGRYKTFEDLSPFYSIFDSYQVIGMLPKR